MTELTKAEIMLNQVTKSNSLIRQLELCKNRPIPPLRLDLRPSTKSTIKAFQENVQGRIDQLTAQRETVLALVEQIPDGADTGWRSPACLAVALWSFGQCYKENTVA